MHRVLAVVAVVAFAQSSWAACNVIPDPMDQLVGAPDLKADASALIKAVQAEETRFGGLRYKGALGRIDHAFLTPQGTGSIRVAADGQCVSGGDPRVFALDDTDDLIAAVIVGDESGRSHAVVAAGKAMACAAFTAAATGEQLQITGCASGGITTVDEHPRVVEITLPARAPVKQARAARVVLLRADSIVNAGRALVAAATASDCAALCQGAAGGSLGVCIDDLYAPTGLTASQTVVYGAQDLVKCELMETPTPNIPWNDFRAQCEDGPGSAGFPACKNGPSSLTFWEDGCHGVYVPFDWEKIRFTDPTDPDSDEFDREVRGQTALSVKGEDQGGRVWIPGREFVGTLLEQDVTGTGGSFTSDPRRARVDLHYPTDQEFGLKGIVDKNKSIVHVVPRLAVTRLCDRATDEACTGVPTDPNDDATRCACTDRYPADCTCVTVTKARLFQCSDTGMPCTRHQHCNPNGLCNAQPTCMAAETVWEKGATVPAGAKCWDDSHCKDPTVPGYDAAKPQCGYLLFNVRAKRENNKSEVVLKPQLTGMGKKRRGVCAKTGPVNRLVCSNAGGPPACAAAQGDCTEYVLEALGGTKVTP